MKTDVCQDKEQSIPDETIRYPSISDCAEAGLIANSHKPFVDFFLDRTKTSQELFRQKFSYYLDKQSLTRKDYEQWKILKFDDFLNCSINYENAKFVGVKTIDAWKSGRNLPDKYAVVQLAVYLKLSLQQTNHLLLLSENEMLYPVSRIDVLCICFINTNAPAAYAEDILVQLKEYINQYCIGDNGYNSDLSTVSPIEEQKIKESNIQLQKPDPSRDDYYITRFYQKCAEKINDGTISTYMDSNEFVSLRLAFCRMTDQFLKGQTFAKNMVRYDIDFSENCPTDTVVELSEGRVRGYEPLNDVLCDYLNKMHDQKKLSDTNVMHTMRMLMSIQGLNLFDEHDLHDTDRSGKKNSAFDRIVFGEMNGKKYHFILNKRHTFKKNIILFCLAAGREDDLGRYLKAGNVWEENWFEKSSRINEEINGLDAILIYAFHYKEKLIESWTESWKKSRRKSESEAATFKMQLKRFFPMIRLISKIEEEIESGLHHRALTDSQKEQIYDQFIFY